MQPRLSLQNCALLVLLAIVLAQGLAGPSTGQAPIPSAGRYQLVVAPNPSNDAIYVFDPQTGECWFRQHAGNIKWASLGSPIGKQQAK